MHIDEQTIQRLMDEASNTVTPDDRYGRALDYIDMDTLKRWYTPGTITPDELAMTAAAAGFMAGMRYTLENLNILDDDPEKPSNSDNRPYGN